jgi:hypothetical protein
MTGQGSVPGWVGTLGQVLGFLRAMGADVGPDRCFLVDGGIATFLGMDGDDAETIVDAVTVFYVGGVPRNLADGLQASGCGSRVFVIM